MEVDFSLQPLNLVAFDNFAYCLLSIARTLIRASTAGPTGMDNFGNNDDDSPVCKARELERTPKQGWL